jgi:hypothetical protein
MRYDSAGRFMIGARGSFGLHEPESYFRASRARLFISFTLPIDRWVQLGGASHEGSFRYQAARRWK